MVQVDVQGAELPPAAYSGAAVRLIATRRTVLVRSATVVEDVEEITAETVRHGVTFIRYVPFAAFEQQGAMPLVAGIGYQIDSALDLDWVDAASFVQEVDAQGLITNAVEFTVSVPPPSLDQPGPFQSSTVIPLQVIRDGPAWISMLEAARQTLLDNLYG